jgi:hypothetical protein
MANMFDEFVPKEAVPKAKPPNMFDEFVPDDGEHLARALGAGVVKGTTGIVGGLGDIRDLAGRAAEYVGAKVGVPDLKEKAAGAIQRLGEQPTALGGFVKLATAAPTGAEVRRAVEEHTTGPLYEPKTRGERVAGTIGEFLPGSALSPARSVAGVMANALRYGAVPGATSELAGQAAHASAFPWLETPARMGASLLTPAGVGRAALPGTARRAIPEDVEMARALQREGVQPSVGQILGEKKLKFKEEEIHPEFNRQQLEQFTAAAGNRIGLPATRLTHGPGGNFTQRLDEIGDQFNQLSQRNTLHADQQLVQDLGQIHHDYHNIPGIYKPETLAAVNGMIGRISSALSHTGGTMAGGDYQALRSGIKKAAMGADTEKSAALHDVVEALDNTMERSIARTNPVDARLWPQARRDYRNALVLEDALGKSGSGTSKGIITPSQLESSAKSIYGKRAYLRGQDDFSNLSTPGTALLERLPSSGTTERAEAKGGLFANATTKLTGAALGTAAAPHLGHEPVTGLLMGELAAIMAQPLVNRSIDPVKRALTMSGPAIAYRTGQFPGQAALGAGPEWMNAANMVRALQFGQGSGPGSPPPARPKVYVRPSQLTQ